MRVACEARSDYIELAVSREQLAVEGRTQTCSGVYMSVKVTGCMERRPGVPGETEFHKSYQAMCLRHIRRAEIVSVPTHLIPKS